nr:hypothetical protein [Tanacetum cinerariifolium]
SPNDIKGFVQLGFRQGHMGRSGKAFWYYSGGGEVHRKAGGSNTLSWKPYQGGSSKLNLPDHRIKRYLNAVGITVAHIDVITALMKECRAPRNQDFKHKETTKKSVLVETPTSTTLVSCDGLGGYDWSDQAEEGPNYALMAYTSSSSDVKISTDFTCSQTCLETVKTLKSQNEQLLKDLKKSELMVLGYKTGARS